MQYVNPAFARAPIMTDRARSSGTEALFNLEKTAARPGGSEAEPNAANSPSIVDGPMLLASRQPSAQQMKDLKFLYTVATDPNASATNIKIAKDFLSKWLPPKEELQFLKQTASKVVKNYVDAPNSRATEYAKNWSGYTENEKKAVITDFVNSMNKSMGTSFNVNFLNLPPTNNVTYGAYYNHPNNTIMINMHPSANKSYGQNLIYIMHEAAHGIYFNQTRGMDPNSIMAAIQKGSLSYTAGVADVNMFATVYMTAEKEGWEKYTANPHEFVAHSLQLFGERELKARGIASGPTLPAGHRILEHIKRLKL